MFTATGSPITAFVDALKVALLADATLATLVSTRVYGHIPEADRATFPLVQLGRRSRDDKGGAMQLAGGTVSVQLDCWGGVGTNKGPYEVQRILSRIAAVLERQTLLVTGFSMLQGSLHCEMEEVFDEPDDDMPERRLYHGVQRWSALIEERL